jgi:hypothetical protein
MDASSNNERRVMFRNWMNSWLCVLPDPSAILLEIERPAARNWATLVEAVSNSMEFYRQIHRLVPDLEILKAPVRPSPPATDSYALRTLLFAIVICVFSHNHLLHGLACDL